jgi:hypothetical protein
VQEGMTQHSTARQLRLGARLDPCCFSFSHFSLFTIVGLDHHEKTRCWAASNDGGRKGVKGAMGFAQCHRGALRNATEGMRGKVAHPPLTG